MALINLSRYFSQDIWTWKCGLVWQAPLVEMLMAQSLTESTVGRAACNTQRRPQIKTLMPINVQQRHTHTHTYIHTKTIHAHNTYSHFPPQEAFMKPWQTAKLTQFAWVLPAVCLWFKPDWVWSWTVSSNNQSLWHKQIKQSLYRSPGNVSKTLWYTHTHTVHLASTLDGFVLSRPKTLPAVAWNSEKYIQCAS